MSGISSQFEFGSCLDYGSRATVGVGYGPAEDGLRARYAPASGGLYYLFLWDPQGSVQQRHTDDSYTGGYAAYDRSAFEGYGALRQANKGSTGAIVGQHDPAGFGGQFGYYTDTETGLLCLTHRYYDPGTGKFINRDPIGYQGGANLYGFCEGNPINWSDPSGLDRDWLDNTADFTHGAGGIISCGLTDWIDHKLGVDGGIDKHSKAFHAGQITGVGYNVVSTVVGGVGVVNGIRAYRAARTVVAATPIVAQVVTNGIRGRAFEAAAIQALGATKNTATLTGTTLAGVAKTTIPDVVQAGQITEIKDVIQLSYSAQLQSQISIATARGIPYNLIVGLNTGVSGPLLNAVRATGGGIRRFDAAAGVFRAFP